MLFLNSTSELEFTGNEVPTHDLQITREPQFTSEPQFTQPVNPSSKTGEPQFRDIEVLTTKEQLNNNRESARERKLTAVTLPENFFPNDEHHKKCAEKDLDINSLLEKFKIINRENKAVDWNMKFKLFISRERKPIQKKNGEIKSIVGWFNGNH